jgi:spermidine synthase
MSESDPGAGEVRDAPVEPGAAAPGGRPPLGVQVVLLASVFVVAACGLVYELAMGAVSSYLLGDAITQFSLVIGVFLCAMGVGSFIAKFVRRRLLHLFVDLEIWIGLLGGTSSITMFAVNAYLEEVFAPVFYGLCAVLGALVGIEIPLLVRILRQGRESMSDALSHVLALDYLGALVGSLVFPLVALPFLGLSRASVVFGIMNLAVAAAGLTLVRERRRMLLARLVIASLVLATCTVASARLVGYLEDLLYQDSVVFARDTPYQRIVITRWRTDVRLYLNGHLQLSSIDEARYHEPLVIPAMETAVRRSQVLILGGGDGLAAREVLKYPDIEQITVVDIDPEMTGLARTRRELVALNRGSFASPKVHVVHEDALRFVRGSEAFYDVIIIDLPDPSTAMLAKLYSRAFYAMVARRLTAGGVLVTQATSPYFAPEAFWCIVATIEGAVTGPAAATRALEATPYHVNVPSFGEWGFVLATSRGRSPGPAQAETRAVAADEELPVLHVSVPTRFLDDRVLRAMFWFGKDMPRLDMEPNSLELPVLHRYYERGWARFNQ